MTKLFIVGAKRTPQGRLLGAFVKRSAADLAKEAGSEILKTIDPGDLDLSLIHI